MNLNKLSIIWRTRNIIQHKNVILIALNPLSKCYFVTKPTNKNDGSNNSSSSSSSTSSDSDDSTAKSNPDQETKNQETMTKLNSLLQQLVQNDSVAKKSDIQLSRPTSKRLSKEERQSRKVETVEKKIIKAVTGVAQDIGGNVQQTESELLSKLLRPTELSESKNLSEIVKGMKIEREKKSVEATKADQIRNILQNMKSRDATDIKNSQTKPRRRSVQYHPKPLSIQKIDLFGGAPLNIFTNSDLKEMKLNTWQTLYERDLKLAVTHPPANYFQEMILWTEQGKIWKFPIDNEQGMDEEKKVDFTKHIFLEEHLDPWCPTKGPIRHFMELVCVGLSKNSYLTVEAKIEHINWYKNYFEEKKKLLQETGAIPTDGENSAKQQQIES